MIEKSSIPFPIVRLGQRFKGGINAFKHHLPLHVKHSQQQPFFILGSGRSGNTLLRAMLVAGEQVAIPPESYVLPRVVRQFLTFGYQSWQDIVAMVIDEFESFDEFYTWNLDLTPVHAKAMQLAVEERCLARIIDLIYQEYALTKYGTPRRWGDKTPKNAEFLEHITSTFPKAQYIHLIRDPRAVFLSYKNAKIKAYQGPQGAKKVVQFWLNCHQHIEHCKLQNPSAFKVVHYGDLVNQPETTLMSLSEFLGIEYRAQMLEFWSNSELGDVEAHNHHANVLTPISTASTNQWRTELNNEDRLFVEKHCLRYYEKLCDQYPATHP